MYRFPKLEFDRTSYVSLNEAFHILGTFKHPREWTGQEISAFPEISSGSLRKEKDRLAENAKALNEQLMELKRELYAENDTATDALIRKRLKVVEKQEGLAKTKNNEFQRSFQSRQIDSSAFERKQPVEADLLEAIRNSEMEVYLDSGTVYGSMSEWVSDRYFRACFSHSFIVTPQNFDGRRKHRAYFRKSDFESWSEHLRRDLTEFETENLADALVTWFKRFSEKQKLAGARPTRQSVVDESNRTFARAGETENLDKLVGSVWDLYAPSDWKKGGKPQTSKGFAS